MKDSRRKTPFSRAARLGLVLVTALVATALTSAAAQRVTVLTHSSFSLPAEVISEFTRATGIEVVFLPGGDAGEVVNRAILTKARPVADVLFGVDDSLLERARGSRSSSPTAARH